MNEQSKKTLQMSLFLGLMGLVGIGYYYFMFGRKEIDIEKTQQAKLSAEIKDLDAQLSKIAEAERNREAILQKAAEAAKASSRLPTSPDDEGFLWNLEDMLRKSGLVHNKIGPGKVADYQLYSEIPWQIDAIGRYGEIGAFLNLVELNPKRFMRVKTFTIGNKPTTPGRHPIQLEISTFMLRNRPPAAKPAPAATPKPAPAAEDEFE